MARKASAGRLAFENRLRAWARDRTFVLNRYEVIKGERGTLICEACGSKRPTILYPIFQILTNLNVKVELGALPPMRHCDPSPIFTGSCCVNTLHDFGLLRTRNVVGYDFPMDGIRKIWQERYASSDNKG